MPVICDMSKDFPMMLLQKSIFFITGPEAIPPALVKVCVSSIAAAADAHQYPPVNWASILAPLMRLNFGKSF